MFFVLFNVVFFVLVKITETYKITNMIYFSWPNCVSLFLICTFSTLQFLVFTNGRFVFFGVRYFLHA